MQSEHDPAITYAKDSTGDFSCGSTMSATPRARSRAKRYPGDDGMCTAEQLAAIRTEVMSKRFWGRPSGAWAASSEYVARRVDLPTVQIREWRRSPWYGEAILRAYVAHARNHGHIRNKEEWPQAVSVEKALALMLRDNELLRRNLEAWISEEWKGPFRSRTLSRRQRKSIFFETPEQLLEYFLERRLVPLSWTYNFPPLFAPE